MSDFVKELRFHGRYAGETQQECAERKNSERESAADEIECLRAAPDEALEVMKPFGDRAVAWKHNADSARVSVRLADLRAARRFYEKHKGGGDG
jgi:hypothetical protein